MDDLRVVHVSNPSDHVTRVRQVQTWDGVRVAGSGTTSYVDTGRGRVRAVGRLFERVAVIPATLGAAEAAEVALGEVGELFPVEHVEGTTVWEGDDIVVEPLVDPLSGAITWVIARSGFVDLVDDQTQTLIESRSTMAPASTTGEVLRRLYDVDGGWDYGEDYATSEHLVRYDDLGAGQCKAYLFRESSPKVVVTCDDGCVTSWDDYLCVLQEPSFAFASGYFLDQQDAYHSAMNARHYANDELWPYLDEWPGKPLGVNVHVINGGDASAHCDNAAACHEPGVTANDIWLGQARYSGTVYHEYGHHIIHTVIDWGEMPSCDWGTAENGRIRESVAEVYARSVGISKNDEVPGYSDDFRLVTNDAYDLVLSWNANEISAASDLVVEDPTLNPTFNLWASNSPGVSPPLAPPTLAEASPGARTFVRTSSQRFRAPEPTNSLDAPGPEVYSRLLLEEWTVDAWVRVNNLSTNKTIIAHGNDGEDLPSNYLLSVKVMGTGKIEWLWERGTNGANVWGQTAAIIQPNKTYHIAVSRRSSAAPDPLNWNVWVYVTELGSDTTTVYTFLNKQPAQGGTSGYFSVGSHYSYDYFDGTIDNIRIHFGGDSYLSPAQTRDLEPARHHYDKVDCSTEYHATGQFFQAAMRQILHNVDCSQVWCGTSASAASSAGAISRPPST